jgi:uncharacterized protein YrrD
VSRLMRASEINKRPVVTFAGEDVAQVKDIVYAAGGGQVGGFTLNGRGLLAGPLKTALFWSAVAGLGRDAVMIDREEVLQPREHLLADTGVAGQGHGGDVLHSRVLTDDGMDLGEVVDVIIEIRGQGDEADVVGYEVNPSAALGQGGKKVLIPLPDTLAASGEHLIVPASAREFVGDDLAGFGASVEAFRAQLQRGHDAVQ